MAMKVFIPFRKKPFFQPARDMCLTTAVKNVIDNQFNINLSLSAINKSCKYEGKYQWGVAIDNFLEQNINKILERVAIKYNFRENQKIEDLFQLLETEKAYPIIFFPLSKSNEWTENTSLREVSGDNEPNLHALIIVGIDKENETIQMFDTIHNKFREYSDLNSIYDEISFVKFLQYWLHSSLVFPAIWFLKKVKDKKIGKDKDRTLELWQLKKK